MRLASVDGKGFVGADPDALALLRTRLLDAAADALSLRGEIAVTLPGISNDACAVLASTTAWAEERARELSWRIDALEGGYGAYAFGYGSPHAAADAGRDVAAAFAVVRHRLDAGTADLHDLAALAAAVRLAATNERFAAALFDALGPAGVLGIVRDVQGSSAAVAGIGATSGLVRAHSPAQPYDGDPVERIVEPLAAAIATALRAPGGGARAAELLGEHGAGRDPWALSQLVRSATFDSSFMVAAGRVLVIAPALSPARVLDDAAPDDELPLWPDDGVTAAEVDPAAAFFEGLARDPAAAAAFFAAAYDGPLDPAHAPPPATGRTSHLALSLAADHSDGGAALGAALEAVSSSDVLDDLTVALVAEHASLAEAGWRAPDGLAESIANILAPVLPQLVDPRPAHRIAPPPLRATAAVLRDVMRHPEPRAVTLRAFGDHASDAIERGTRVAPNAETHLGWAERVGALSELVVDARADATWDEARVEAARRDLAVTIAGFTAGRLSGGVLADLVDGVAGLVLPDDLDRARNLSERFEWSTQDALWIGVASGYHAHGHVRAPAGAPFVDARGRVIPLDRLSPRQERALRAWVASEPVRDVIDRPAGRIALSATETRARLDGYP